MKNNKRKLKAIVLSMVLAAGMLLPVGASAQDDSRHGGLFGLFGLFNSEEEEVGLLDRGGSLSEEGGYSVLTEQFGGGVNGNYALFTEQFGSNDDGGYNITTEQFGNDAPLGSGLFIMAAAGAGYALKKRKNNK